MRYRLHRTLHTIREYKEVVHKWPAPVWIVIFPFFSTWRALRLYSEIISICYIVIRASNSNAIITRVFTVYIWEHVCFLLSVYVCLAGLWLLSAYLHPVCLWRCVHRKAFVCTHAVFTRMHYHQREYKRRKQRHQCGDIASSEQTKRHIYTNIGYTVHI